MSENKWIAVGEQLPQVGAPVLITRGFNIALGFMQRDQTWRGVDNAIAPRPTHWQPLPDPPPRVSSFEAWWQSLPVAVASFSDRHIEGHITRKEVALACWNAGAAAIQGDDYIK